MSDETSVRHRIKQKSSATKQVIELSFPAIVAISAPRHSYTHLLRQFKTGVDWAWVLAKIDQSPFCAGNLHGSVPFSSLCKVFSNIRKRKKSDRKYYADDPRQ